MADNYLITGYHGEPHVTVENDRGFNAAVFGTGKFVLPVGQAFRAERVGSNTIRMYDGKLLDNGALAGIPAGEYIDFTIQEAGRSRNRLDVIIFEYSRNGSTLVESGVFKVISGAETTGEPSFPALTENDLLTNMASFDQMALWVISVSGSNISDPFPIFDIAQNLAGIYGEFIRSYEKGSTNGVATLDSSGKVPSSQLPSMNYIPTSQKGAASGVASLDSSGKVPSSQLPSMDYIPTSQKGSANGVASLDSSGKVQTSQIPSLNYIPTSQKGVASGVASLDSTGKVPESQLPSIEPEVTTGAGSMTLKSGDSTTYFTLSDVSVRYRCVGKICFVKASGKINSKGTVSTVYFEFSNMPSFSTPSFFVSDICDASYSDSGNSFSAKHLNARAYGNGSLVNAELYCNDYAAFPTGYYTFSFVFVYAMA